jgi:transcriptional regulator of acetoin/glycerol metabolism
VKHLSLPQRSNSTITEQAASSGIVEERAALVKALEAAHWNRRRAAKALSIPYSTLLYKMQKLRIE